MWHGWGRRKTQMGSDGKHVWKKYLLECLGKDGQEIMEYMLNKGKGGRQRWINFAQGRR
jgi:hypothetical protein